MVLEIRGWAGCENAGVFSSPDPFRQRRQCRAMSAIDVCIAQSGPSAILPHHDICERIAGLQNRSFPRMNQRPKLGGGGRAPDVHLRVSGSDKF